MSNTTADVPAGLAISTGKKLALRRKNLLSGYLFISPWLVGFFAFTLIPVMATFVLAFTDYDIFTAPQWVGLKNFRTMFLGDPRYWRSVKATLYFAFASVPLKLVFALAIAMVLSAGYRLVAFYRAIFYAPSIVGASVAVAVMWREIFGTEGLVNALLGFLGLPDKTVWLGNPDTAIWTLILLVVWQFGSPMLIFLAGLKQIPTELYESASIDGTSRTKKFLFITLPMLSPIIFFNLVMQIIFGFTTFTQAFIITGGTPLDTTNFYALYLYRRTFETLEMGYGAGMAWILLLAIALATALVFKSSPHWVHYEAKEGR